MNRRKNVVKLLNNIIAYILSYFQFKGKIGRKEFFIAIAILFLLGIANWILWIAIGVKSHNRTSLPAAFICIIPRIIIMLPTVSIVARRLRDINFFMFGMLFFANYLLINLIFAAQLIALLYEYQYILTQEDIDGMCGLDCSFSTDIELTSLYSYIAIPFWISGMPGIFEMIIAIILGSAKPESKTH